MFLYLAVFVLGALAWHLLCHYFPNADLWVNEAWTDLRRFIRDRRG